MSAKQINKQPCQNYLRNAGLLTACAGSGLKSVKNMETTNYPGIDYAAGQAVNRNIKTGLRFGVIHQNKISPEAFDDIVTNGTDGDFEAYQDDIREAVKSALESALSDYLSDHDIASVVEAAQDAAVENCGDCYESGGDCTRYEYNADGYSIQTASDGDMFIKESPFFTYAQFCSPCAPGACYLSSPLDAPVEGNKCYCLGKDWFDEIIPCRYPVYSVATGELVP